MLLIGPNQQFLEYVRDALEILGNSDIIMSTPEELTSWKPSNLVDTDEILFLKGFDQITKVIDNYFKYAPSVLDDSYRLKVGDLEIEFTVLDSLDIITNLRNENMIYSQLRARAGVLVSNLLVERFFVKWEKQGRQRRQFDGDPMKIVQGASTYRTILRNMYPDLTPESVLKDLKKSAKVFLESSRSVFEESDIRKWLTHVIPNPFDIRSADIPILDYIKYRIEGTSEIWGHIAIDEAQDLTPMQLGMLRRRTDSASSLSLTGDLAQATGVVVYETWPAITSYLSDEEPLQDKLTRSYRVPKEILQYADQFLALSEVDVEPAEPFLEKSDSLILDFPYEGDAGVSHAESLISKYLQEEKSVLLVAETSNVERFKKMNFEVKE
jgi:DNA helicase IV